MAIQTYINLYNGLGVNNGYIKIDSFSGDKNTICINVKTYVNKDYSNDRNSYICQSNYFFEPNLDCGDNFLCQGYRYLKTLPEFQGAIDC